MRLKGGTINANEQFFFRVYGPDVSFIHLWPQVMHMPSLLTRSLPGRNTGYYVSSCGGRARQRDKRGAGNKGQGILYMPAAAAGGQQQGRSVTF